MEFGNLVGPLALSVLYPRTLTPKASPKAISGRTSYHQVRLAFHPYPHLIQRFFNNDWFEPSRGFTRVSPWTWIAHLASGLLKQTRRPVQTRFRYGSSCYRLNLACSSNSPVHSTKGTPSGLTRLAAGHSPLTACKHTVSGSISLPSRGSFHAFPHGTAHYRSEGRI